MVHVYHSLSSLYFAEMRVLTWASWVVLAVAVGYGTWLYLRFRRRQRTVLGAGIHLGLAAAVWIFYLLLYYYWGSGHAYWAGKVPTWHHSVFLLGGLLLAAGSVLGLVLHHSPPRPRVTPRLAWTHIACIVCGVAGWTAGILPFR